MDTQRGSRYRTSVRRFCLLLLTSLTFACPKATDPTAKPAGNGATSQPAPPPKAEPAPPPAEAQGALGAPCASTAACQAGLTCTTEAGACDRPPGCGPEDICPAVCYGVCAEAAAAEGACESDADCRAFSDYCGGCACEALRADAPDPKCSSKPVSCVMNPCRGKVARCLEGACVLRDAAPEE